MHSVPSIHNQSPPPIMPRGRGTATNQPPYRSVHIEEKASLQSASPPVALEPLGRVAPSHPDELDQSMLVTMCHPIGDQLEDDDYGPAVEEVVATLLTMKTREQIADDRGQKVCHEISKIHLKSKFITVPGPWCSAAGVTSSDTVNNRHRKSDKIPP